MCVPDPTIIQKTQHNGITQNAICCDVFFLDPQAYFLLYSPSKKELLIILQNLCFKYFWPILVKIGESVNE